MNQPDNSNKTNEDTELRLPPGVLMVFIDETGNEDYSDPNNPIFGRGGCAIMSENYKHKLHKPWRKLKRDYFGGANKVFHTSEIRNFLNRQIHALNRFVNMLPFYRLGRITDNTITLPKNFDGHKIVPATLIGDIITLAKELKPNSIELIFESSERGNKLVTRDFHLEWIESQIHEKPGKFITVNGNFIDKKSLNSGIEVADLILHTIQRQARRIEGDKKFNKDFIELIHNNKDFVLKSIMFIKGCKINSPT